MSSQENREFIVRYANALNGKPKPDSVLNQFMTDTALKEHIQFFEAAFPSYRIDPDEIIAEGDKVVLRVTFHGSHQGDFLGIPASGKQVSTTGIVIYRLQDGKIVEHWMNFDTETLMKQLAAVPAAV